MFFFSKHHSFFSFYLDSFRIPVEFVQCQAVQILLNCHNLYSISSFKRFFFNFSFIYFYLIIIIIIMLCRQHGYPWPSLATSPYYSSPLAGLQGYILCPHIVAVCKFVLVVLLLHIHMWGSTGVHRLWARPCFSSSVPGLWFV